MPSEAKAAVKALSKLIIAGKSLCRIGFNSSKCKTEAKLAMARIKLLRNKREVQIRQMRRDVALLLENSQDATARIRVEHVIREQNIMAANEIIELFCELIVTRLPIIAKQKNCPSDLKEGIASLIFAAPRCSEIPELTHLCDVFEKKYGRDFVSAAMDLRADSGVNRTLIEKLSVRTPGGEVKLKIMKEIAKEYQVDWDTTESELELLQPPEEPLKGPTSFISAADLRSSHEGKALPQFRDSMAAAEAAKALAEQATAAAEVAAHLARRSSQPGEYMTHLDNILAAQDDDDDDDDISANAKAKSSEGSFVEEEEDRITLNRKRYLESDEDNDKDEEEEDDDHDDGKESRRGSHVPDFEELAARFDALRRSST